MQIDLHNYEAFFLDYKEGNLSAAQEKELFAFLEQYPELRAELDAYEALMIEPVEQFEGKENLKKTEFGREALVAYTEGLLTAEEKKELETLAAKNNALAKELNLYKSTVLQADKSIVFPNKIRLKRGGVIVFLQSNTAYLRVAAAILLMVGLYFLLDRMSRPGEKKNVPEELAAGNPVRPEVENEKKMNPSYQGNAVLTATVNAESVAENGDAIRSLHKNHRTQHPLKVKAEKQDTQKIINGAENNPVAIESDNKGIKEQEEPVAVANATKQETDHVYEFNYARPDVDDKDEKTEPVLAMAPSKKTFFQKVSGLARKANGLGAKNINSEDNGGKNSILLGGLVVTESFSN